LPSSLDDGSMAAPEHAAARDATTTTGEKRSASDSMVAAKT